MKNTFKILVLVLLALTFIFPSSAIGQELNDKDLIIGSWEPKSKNSIIRFVPDGDKFIAKLIYYYDSYDDAGNMKKDIHNPDPNLRKRNIVGITIIKDLVFDGDQAWTSGEIYQPKAGKFFDCRIEILDENSIKIIAYKGFTVFGKSKIWYRKQR